MYTPLVADPVKEYVVPDAVVQVAGWSLSKHK